MISSQKIIDDLALFDRDGSTSFRLLSQNYARAVAQRIKRGFEEHQEGKASGWWDLIDVLLSDTSASVWNPLIGRANTLARRGEHSLPLAMAQYLLSLVPAAIDGRFEFQLAYPDQLAVGHRWFQCAGRTVIEVQAGKVRIESGADHWEFPNRDPSSSDAENIRLCSVSSLHLVWGYGIDPAIVELGDQPLSGELVDAACSTVSSALKQVFAVGADSQSWVERSIRVASIMASASGNRLSSRSSALRPGNIEIAAPGNRLHLAELFIHEAAHQHFNLGALLGKYVRPEASELLVYSALKGSQRSLERVAMAFHAIANIYVFLDRLACQGGSDGVDAAHRICELGPVTHSLFAEIETHWAKFTPNGLSLMEPIMGPTQRILDHYGAPVVKGRDQIIVGAGG